MFALVKVKLLISLRDILTGFQRQRQKLGFWLVGTNNFYQNEMPTKIQTNGASLYLKVQSLEYPEQRLLSCCLMSLSPVCSRPAELPTSRLCTSALKEQCHQTLDTRQPAEYILSFLHLHNTFYTMSKLRGESTFLSKQFRNIKLHLCPIWAV